MTFPFPLVGNLCDLNSLHCNLLTFVKFISQLCLFVESKGLVNDRQYGVRLGRSADDFLSRVSWSLSVLLETTWCMVETDDYTLISPPAISLLTTTDVL